MRQASLLLLSLAAVGAPGVALAAGTGTDEMLSDAERVPPSVIFLVDRSVTMDSPCYGSTSTDSCLTVAKRAIGDVVRHFDFARYGVIGTADSASDDSFYRVAPVGSTYAEIAAALGTLSSSGTSVRNLAETLESVQTDYLMQASYENYTDDDLDGFTGDWAESPIAFSCSDTHVIVLTAGSPNEDDQIGYDASHAAVSPDVMCDSSGLSATEAWCYYDNMGAHLYNWDTQASLSGTQRVILHTIYLGDTSDPIAPSLYANAADQTAGEGTYNTASEGQDILSAVLTLQTEIQAGEYTRSAPVVTSDGQYLIYSFYAITGDNPLAEGHVRRYDIDNDPSSSTYGDVLYNGPSAYGGAAWDGGDLLVSRPVVTNDENDGDMDGFSYRDIFTWEDNAAAVMPEATDRRLPFDVNFVNAMGGGSTIGLYLDTSSSGTAAAADAAHNVTWRDGGDLLIDQSDMGAMVDFIRGLPTGEFRYIDLARGQWKLGDSPYAVPAVVTARNDRYTTDPTYRRFLERQELSGHGGLVLLPANDGMLHAFALEDYPEVWTGNAGEELWAWVPGYSLIKDRSVEWSNAIWDLPVYGRTFLFDSSPVIEDVWIDGLCNNFAQSDGLSCAGDGSKDSSGAEWHRVVVVSQGMGGPMTLALDITNPRQPTFLWEQMNNADYTAMGYTLGKPVVANVYDSGDPDGAQDHWVAIWGGGQAVPWASTSSGVNYWETAEPSLYMWALGNDPWGDDDRSYNLGGINAGTSFFDYDGSYDGASWGTSAWSELDLGTDSANMEHAYISASIAAVDVDSDGDHDVLYFPVTTAYTPRDEGGVGPSSPTVPGSTYMYKAVLNTANPDQPSWVLWYDPMDGTVDQSYGNGIGARPTVFYSATAAWRSDGSLGLYWGSGTPFDRDNTTSQGYFFAMYDADPLSVTSTAQAITCDGHEGYYPLDYGEGLTSPSVVYAGVVYFSTYTPNADRCEAGTGRIYGLRFDDCSPGIDTNGDGVADAGDDASISTEGYVSGVTVTSQGRIYYADANPEADEDRLHAIEAATDPFLGTAAIAWMQVM